MGRLPYGDGSTPPFRRALVGPAVFCLVGARAHSAELRISNLSVFLNDYDVTVHVVLLGAIPSTLFESVQTGIPVHVRLHVELWQYNRFLADRRITERTVERQLTYNVLTKEYKVVSPKGEQREPYLTKDLREAQRVTLGGAGGQSRPRRLPQPWEIYYVRVQSDVSLNGVNSWFTRFTGDAEETDWVRSSLLTVTRSQ